MRLAVSIVALVAATMLYSVAASAATDEEVLRRLETLESNNAKLEKEDASLRGQVRHLKNSKQVARTELEGRSMPTSAPLSATAAYESAPMPASRFNWTGFYIGAHTGYGAGAVQAPSEDPGNPSDTRPAGGFGGGQF